MEEFDNVQENITEDKREEIKQKLRQYYDGRIVRKDLTKSIREGANVPVYVLEYLLGQYCNSYDEEIIEEGVENVKRILRDNYVRPGEKRATDYPVGKNWFTDRGDKNLIENDCLGSKTVSKWRNDAMEDWGKRWSWLKK